MKETWNLYYSKSNRLGLRSRQLVNLYHHPLLHLFPTGVFLRDESLSCLSLDMKGYNMHLLKHQKMIVRSKAFLPSWTYAYIQAFGGT